MQIATRAQGPHFLDQTHIEHGVKALCDALVQPAARLWFQRNQGRWGQAVRCRWLS